MVALVQENYVYSNDFNINSAVYCKIVFNIQLGIFQPLSMIAKACDNKLDKTARIACDN